MISEMISGVAREDGYCCRGVAKTAPRTDSCPIGKKISPQSTATWRTALQFMPDGFAGTLLWERCRVTRRT